MQAVPNLLTIKDYIGFKKYKLFSFQHTILNKLNVAVEIVKHTTYSVVQIKQFLYVSCNIIILCGSLKEIVHAENFQQFTVKNSEAKIIEKLSPTLHCIKSWDENAPKDT